MCAYDAPGARGHAAHRGDPGAQGHRRREPEVGAGRAVAEGRQPVHADADAHDVVARLRVADRLLGRGEVAGRGSEPGLGGRGERPLEGRALRRVDVARGVGEVAEHADDGEPPLALELGRPGDGRGPVLLGHAVAAEARVDLQVHARRAGPAERMPRARAARGSRSRAPRRRRPPAAKSASGSCSHARIGASIPAARSASASSRSATPSRVAPPARAARAASTAPCP